MRQQAEVHNTLQDLHNSSDDTKAKFNNCFIFIQSNSQYKNMLKCAYLYRIFSRLWGMLIGKFRLFRLGLFSSTNTVLFSKQQLSSVKLSSCGSCYSFQQTVHLFIPCQTSEMFHHFFTHYQLNNSTLSTGLFG